MAGFGGYNEKKKKKAKQGGGQQNTPVFSSKPVFVPPTVIKKDKTQE